MKFKNSTGGIVMNIQHLQYLVTLYHTGNMVEAANECFVTQPTISKAVKNLETEFGIRILETSYVNRVVFTSEGEDFVRHAQVILNYSRNMKERFKKSHELSLRVASQHYSFVIESMSILLDRYKKDNYEMTLMESDTKTIMEFVYEGKTELGILYRSQRNQKAIDKALKERSLIFEEMGSCGFRAFMAPKHPLAKKKKVSLEDLAAYPFVCYLQRNYYVDFFEEGYIPDSSQILRVTDRDSMYAIMESNLACTIGTGVVREELDESKLSSRPIEGLDDQIQLGTIRREDHESGRLVQEFVDIVKENFENK